MKSFMTAISDPLLFTYIQREIPREYLGRVNTYLYTSVQLLTPLGVAVYSALFEVFSYQQVYLISGIFVLLVVFLVNRVHFWIRLNNTGIVPRNFVRCYPRVILVLNKEATDEGQ